MLVNSFFIILIFSLPLFSQTHRRFVHVPIEMSWDEARTYCREHHTDLAVFRDQAEYEALLNPCGPKTHCWIGVYREPEDLSIWKWLNGEQVNFLPWGSGQPNDKTAMCVKMKDKLWNDLTCSLGHEFLCYEDPVLVQEEKTWEEALEHCRTLQTNSTSDNDSFYDLPHMHAESNLYTKDLIQNAQTQEVWVGLRFLAGRWFWVNGFPLEEQLEKELPVCPDPRMNCGTMSKTGGRLSLRDCSQRRNFFCLLNEQMY